MWRLVRMLWCAALLVAAVVALPGCGGKPTLASQIDDACGGPVWRSKGGLSAKITVAFPDGTSFNGRLLFQASSGRIVIERLMNGAMEQVGYGHGRFWTLGVPYDDKGQWAQVMRCASFLPASFELRDEGTQVRELYPLTEDGQMYRVGLITRTSEDSPWAICVYQSDHLPRILFPVTKAPPSSAPKVEKKGATPMTRGYAVRFDELSFTDAVALPVRGRVWNWDSRQGVTGEPIASVTLTEPDFGDPDPGGFASEQASNEVSESSGRWWR